MLDGMLLGLETAFTFQNMFFAAFGCFIGTIIGMLPGLGPMSVVAIMIPVSLQIGDPSTTLILLMTCSRFFFLPVEKLSNTVTSTPSATSASTRWLPINPPPPVTITFINSLPITGVQAHFHIH